MHLPCILEAHSGTARVAHDGDLRALLRIVVDGDLLHTHPFLPRLTSPLCLVLPGFLFLTQGLELHPLHWQVSLPLSHLGSPFTNCIQILVTGSASEEPNLRHKCGLHTRGVCTLTLRGTGELLKTDCLNVNLKKCLGRDNRDMAKIVKMV